MSAALLAPLLIGAAAASGAFIWPEGGLFAEGGDGVDGISAVRALIVEDGDEHVIVLQVSAEAVGGGAAWLVPLPGAPTRAPASIDPAGLEPLLRATDPLFPVDPGCGGCKGGCDQTRTFDSGALIDVRTFGAQTAAGNRAWFGPTHTEALLDELRWNGMTVDPPLEAALMAYSAEGWGTLVVQLDGNAWDSTATPMVAIRVAGSEPVLPMLLTARTAAETVHAIVVTAGPTPTRPAGAETTTPLLGEALYTLEWTPVFYEARVKVAIKEAGGVAWVLEYSGDGAALIERQGGRGDEGLVLFGEDTAEVADAPFLILDDLALRGLLPDDLDPATLHFTRWRSYLPVSALTDQGFSRAPGLEDYEVTFSNEDYNGKLQLLWPALVGVAALRRRRRRG
ncbi:MAG: DUF2330 domain-containing protein [Deltaproteobacteria bacterium]|nr:DUF2330 domain-containing protein [Deltaproteobacteria bacterium]